MLELKEANEITATKNKYKDKGETREEKKRNFY
jgi:hypothetical protein